ncbi:MAG: SDR family oxidoreductase [Bacilli bacterium]|nr:SDR family oxidoreductase [Bacilli bacterium]
MAENVLILGASGDIGSAIAKQLAGEGYSLLLHYNRNKEAMKRLVHEIDEERVLQIVQADLTLTSAVHKLCEEIVYPVDAIIYVSGMAHFGLFQDTTEREMDEMLHLHVKAPWLVTKYFLPDMIKKQRGKIIFITSIWGHVGASYEVIYSSVKGAQNSFVKALAKEVGPSGISVNAVSPGFIDTKMNEHVEKETIISQIPLNRAGLASEVAYTVSFLMDDRANYIQGEIINITGGWL